MHAVSSQFSKSQWMPLSPPMSSSSMHLQNTQGYVPRGLTTYLDSPPSTSGLLPAGAVSSRSQDLPISVDATSLEQITPTFTAEDLGTAYPSIGSLTSVSLNLNSNTHGTTDEDLSGLVRDTENLSMEEGIIDQIIKQERITETPELSSTLGQPPMLRVPDLETSIPSFDLSENYLVDPLKSTEIDELVLKGNMG